MAPVFTEAACGTAIMGSAILGLEILGVAMPGSIARGLPIRAVAVFGGTRSGVAIIAVLSGGEPVPATAASGVPGKEPLPFWGGAGRGVSVGVTVPWAGLAGVGKVCATVAAETGCSFWGGGGTGSGRGTWVFSGAAAPSGGKGFAAELSVAGDGLSALDPVNVSTLSLTLTSCAEA